MGNQNKLRGSRKVRSFEKKPPQQAKYQQNQSSEAQIEQKIRRITQTVDTDKQCLLNQLIQSYTATVRHNYNPEHRARQLNTPHKQAFLQKLDNTLAHKPSKPALSQQTSPATITQSFYNLIKTLFELYYSFIKSIYQIQDPNHNEAKTPNNPSRQLSQATATKYHWQFYKPDPYYPFNKTIDLRYQLTHSDCPNNCRKPFEIIEHLFEELFIQPVVYKHNFNLNKSTHEQSDYVLHTNSILDRSTKFLGNTIQFSLNMEGNHLSNVSYWHNLSNDHYNHFINKTSNRFHPQKEPRSSNTFFTINHSIEFIGGAFVALLIVNYLFARYLHKQRLHQQHAGLHNHLPDNNPYRRFSFADDTGPDTDQTRLNNTPS